MGGEAITVVVVHMLTRSAECGIIIRKQESAARNYYFLGGKVIFEVIACSKASNNFLKSIIRVPWAGNLQLAAAAAVTLTTATQGRGAVVS